MVYKTNNYIKILRLVSDDLKSYKCSSNFDIHSKSTMGCFVYSHLHFIFHQFIDIQNTDFGKNTPYLSAVLCRMALEVVSDYYHVMEKSEERLNTYLVYVKENSRVFGDYFLLIRGELHSVQEPYKWATTSSQADRIRSCFDVNKGHLYSVSSIFTHLKSVNERFVKHPNEVRISNKYMLLQILNCYHKFANISFEKNVFKKYRNEELRELVKKINILAPKGIDELIVNDGTSKL